MEVYQAQPLHPQQQQQQQYYVEPLKEASEKAGSIYSGHLYPHTNFTGPGYGYASTLTPTTPIICPHPHADSERDNSKGLSIRRSIALGALAAIFILFAAVIGLAAGLGMTQENLRQARNDLVAVQAKLGVGSTITSTSTSAPTTTSSTITPTATSQPVVQCPAGNGTFYTSTTDSGTTKQFQRICGIDYGKGEATDIETEQAASLDECMNACAENRNCTGAAWGAVGESGKGSGSVYPCYLKKDLIKSHVAIDFWGFGLLITGTGAGAGTGGDEDKGEK